MWRLLSFRLFSMVRPQCAKISGLIYVEIIFFSVSFYGQIRTGDGQILAVFLYQQLKLSY